MNVHKKPQLKGRAVAYLSLCQGNHVAAAIFDWVLTYSEIEYRLRYREPFYVYVESVGGPLGNPTPFQEYLGYKVEVDANLVVTLQDIRDVVTPQLILPALVTDQELFHALDFLREENLVYWSTYYEDEETRSPETDLLVHPLYLDYIDDKLALLHYGHRVTEEKPLYDVTKERRVVREQRSRAGRIGQAASLTFEEWVETLVYFGGKCAFFSDHPYEVLEHFIPVSYGGGTTAFNCIPACRRCNATKNDRLPVDLHETRLGATLPRIQAYLDQRREQWLSKHG